MSDAAAAAAGPAVDVVILAGGKGTRLASVVSDVPKPLALVNGRPFLDYQLQLLQESSGIGRVVLAIGHLADRVIAHYSEVDVGLDLAFSIETTPLGTAGALRNALDKTSSRQLLVLNGDSVFLWNIDALRATHAKAGVDGTISLLQVDDISRYGSVAVESGRVVSFKEKSGIAEPGLINAGAYLFERAALEALPSTPSSLEQNVLPRLAMDGRLAAQTFVSPFIDIGLPETYELARSFIPKMFAERHASSS